MTNSKNKTDFTIFYHQGYNYQISYESLLEINDYYLDFKLQRHSKQAIQKCESAKLRDLINAKYLATEIYNRPSAKIIATDDPRLNEEGVPFLHKILP